MALMQSERTILIWWVHSSYNYVLVWYAGRIAVVLLDQLENKNLESAYKYLQTHSIVQGINTVKPGETDDRKECENTAPFDVHVPIAFYCWDGLCRHQGAQGVVTRYTPKMRCVTSCLNILQIQSLSLIINFMVDLLARKGLPLVAGEC